MTPSLARLVIVALLVMLVGGVSSAASTGGLVAVVKDDTGKAAADAVVSLTSEGSVAPVPRGPRAVMDQVDKTFVPHVLAVTVGTEVAFPNRDNIRHHVYSFSRPKRFELPLYIGTPAAPVQFDKPGVVALGCNIHDWMVGYVYVLATPYFAKTGADGKVTLADLPPGRYDARVWQPRMRADIDRTARPVNLVAGETSEVVFVLSLKPEVQAPRGPGRYEGVQGGG